METPVVTIDPNIPAYISQTAVAVANSGMDALGPDALAIALVIVTGILVTVGLVLRKARRDL